jgi:hypothetical protein
MNTNSGFTSFTEAFGLVASKTLPILQEEPQPKQIGPASNANRLTGSHMIANIPAKLTAQWPTAKPWPSTKILSFW